MRKLLSHRSISTLVARPFYSRHWAGVDSMICEQNLRLVPPKMYFANLAEGKSRVHDPSTLQ